MGKHTKDITVQGCFNRAADAMDRGYDLETAQMWVRIGQALALATVQGCFNRAADAMDRGYDLETAQMWVRIGQALALAIYQIPPGKQTAR